MVGTGDTARGSLPQDLNSLGGKVLRVDLATGQAPPDNPFVDAENPAQRLIYDYGHRNVQGVAVRPGTGQAYSTEHGPSTAAGGQLRLGPGAGRHGQRLRRVGADDRPGAVP